MLSLCLILVEPDKSAAKNNYVRNKSLRMKTLVKANMPLVISKDTKAEAPRSFWKSNEVAELHKSLVEHQQ